VRIYRHIREVPAAIGRVAACSKFEGLHLGHRRLLDELARRAGGAGWVIFDACATPGAVGRLSSWRKCFEKFRDAGVEAVVMAHGVDLRRAVAAVGAGTVLTYAGETTLVDLTGVAGLDPLPAVEVDGVAVSSHALRQAVVAGDLRKASAMLSRPYSVAGRVVHGFHRGASIGVPTANLRVRGIVLPPDGVYAVEVDGGDLGVGVANLGRNPTFGNHERSLETNIFDLDADLYGRRIEIGFVARLRGEQKFDRVEDLAAQIRRDIAAARRIHSGQIHSSQIHSGYE